MDKFEQRLLEFILAEARAEAYLSRDEYACMDVHEQEKIHQRWVKEGNAKIKAIVDGLGPKLAAGLERIT